MDRTPSLAIFYPQKNNERERGGRGEKIEEAKRKPDVCRFRSDDLFFVSQSPVWNCFFEFFFSSCTLGWIVGDLNTVCLDFCRT